MDTSVGLLGMVQTLTDDHLNRLLRYREEDERLGFDTEREQQILRSEIARRKLGGQ